MVSFRKFAVFVIMCCLTGSTSSSILEYSIKPEESTQKGSGEGSAADDTNDVPATGSGATTPSPGPAHNPNAMYGESGTETNVPTSTDKDSDEKLKPPKGSENMYAGDGDDGGTPYNPNVASGTGTSETTSSDKDSGVKPYPPEDSGYNPSLASGTGTSETKSTDKDSGEKLKLPEGSENLYAGAASDGTADGSIKVDLKPYDGPAHDGAVHNPSGMYGESGTGTKVPEDKGDSDSDAEKKAPKEAMYGKDSMYQDQGDDTYVPISAAPKDADSEEKVDIYGSDSIYDKVYADGSEEQPALFGVYEGATCIAGFEPIMSSWQDCKLAAVALNITGDSIGHVDYHTQKGSQAFGTDVPQGCFRDAVTNRVYFNPGKGGSGRKKNDQNKWSDRVVCRQTNADYSYTYGNTCLDGYLAITTSADDCLLAAEYLGLPTGMVVHAANNPCKVGDGIVCRLDYDPSKHMEL